jgi:hypothetical protein
MPSSWRVAILFAPLRKVNIFYPLVRLVILGDRGELAATGRLESDSARLPWRADLPPVRDIDFGRTTYDSGLVVPEFRVPFTVRDPLREEHVGGKRMGDMFRLGVE